MHARPPIVVQIPPAPTVRAIPMARFDTPEARLRPPRDDSTDYWHGSRFICVPLACSVITTISIGFRPTNGPGREGVALTELASSKGLTDPNKRLHPMEPGHGSGRLVFSWPDYPRTRIFAPLDLKDDTGRYVTRKAFGKQIAVLFEKFVRRFSEEYVPPRERNGWRLGPGGIRYEQLRLLEIFSEDGYEFYARMAVAPAPLGTLFSADAIPI
ncbi:hypothetical protein C8R47DRAFT_1227085 [Mycena vitilis]|nr:hypothetical protein C8R47DRAFT_1227085 [Mycena vitilis]